MKSFREYVCPCCHKQFKDSTEPEFPLVDGAACSLSCYVALDMKKKEQSVIEDNFQDRVAIKKENIETEVERKTLTFIKKEENTSSTTPQKKQKRKYTRKSSTK